MQYRRLCATGLGAALLGLGTVAQADVSFGGNARSIGMGGAGIAIVDRSGNTTAENPAALALLNRRVKVEMPGIGLRASGIPLDRAFSHLFGNPDRNDAVTLARDFGRRESSFGVSLGWGARMGHMDARLDGLATVHVLPNAAFQTWASSASGNVALLTGNERADILGAAVYSLPTVGAAERISPAGSPTRVEAGVRVKLERAIYTHYIVDASSLRANSSALSAPELNGGTSLTRDGIGVDFGLLAHPRDHAGFSGALVCTNLLEPGFTFNGTDTVGNPARYNIQPRSFSIGSAYEAGRVVAALDVVDLSRAYGNVQARVGAEYSTRRLAFRVGYASARGFTVGFGYRGFDLAFGAKAPLGISETLRF